MPSLFNDPKHWQERAEMARAIAGQMHDLQAKPIMLEIAGCYERLAQLAEGRSPPAWAAGNKPARPAP